MKPGLEGVVVARTAISLVDGVNGRLIWRGRALESMQDWPYEEVAEHLLGQPLAELGEGRRRSAASIRELCGLAEHLEPIEWLRFCLDRLPGDWASGLAMALVLRRYPAAQPDPAQGHVEDVLRMLRGRTPELWEVEGLRSYWTCVAEHGMNASTFTARVVASTRAGERAALSAALGALQGPLHGGAPGPVLDMLDAVEASGDARAWLESELQQGRRLMGFGHRIYRVRDPRAEVLRSACQRAAHDCPSLKRRLQQAEHLELLALEVLAEHKPDRALQTNVEYYTAILLEALGFDRSEFTAVFACGRVLGWLAHIDEEQKEGRLIRPDAEYCGVVPA